MSYGWIIRTFWIIPEYGNFLEDQLEFSDAKSQIIRILLYHEHFFVPNSYEFKAQF